MLLPLLTSPFFKFSLRDSTRLSWTDLLSDILHLYILSSAFFITSSIASFGSLFVETPREMLKGIFFIPLFLHKLLILLMIFWASPHVVLGRIAINSSPPHLDNISSCLKESFSIPAIFIRNSSPFACPYASFITFKPFTSPITMISGSCLGVLSLFSSSSKYALL